MISIQKLRNPYFMRWFLWVILIVTIPAFVLFYAGGPSAGGGLYFGPYVTIETENGQIELTGADLEASRNRAANYYINFAVASGQLPPQQSFQAAANIQNRLDPLDVAKFAVSEVALEERLRRQGIRVTDRQVSRYLSEQGLTREQLRNILQTRRITEADYAAIQRRDLKNALAADTVSRAARTSLLELWNQYRLENEMITAESVRITIQPDPDLDISGELVRTKYEELVEARDNAVIDPPRRVYEYVALKLPALDSVEPTEEELREAYENAPADDGELVDRGGLSVRQVFVEVPADASEGERAEARARIEQARARIEAGEPFAQVANEITEDPANNVTTGGDAPPTQRGGLIPGELVGDEIDEYGVDFITFINEADANVLSEVLEVPGGFAIAEVLSRREPGRLSFERARPVLRERLVEEKTALREAQRTELIRDNLTRLRSAAASNTTLDGVAAELGVEVGRTSPTLASSTSITGIGNLQEEREALVGLIPGRMTPVLQASNGTVAVLKLVEFIDERVRDLAEVETRVEDLVRRDMARDEAMAQASELRTRVVESGDSFTSVVLELGLQADPVEPFPRAEPPAFVQRIPAMVQDIYTAEAGDILIEEFSLFNITSQVVILHLLEVESPSRETFLEDLGNLEAGMLLAKQSGFIEEYRRQALMEMDAEFNEVLLDTE